MVAFRLSLYLTPRTGQVPNFSLTNPTTPASRLYYTNQMTRALLLLCWFSLLATTLRAQGFELRLIDYTGSSRQGLCELAALPNGNLLLYGHHFRSGDADERGGLLAELDAAGNATGEAMTPADSYAQFADVLVAADGSTVLLTTRQDIDDFRNRFGLIWRDPAGNITRSRTWLGGMRAFTRTQNGSYFLVGRGEEGARGSYALVSSQGELLLHQNLFPTTNRPATLQDVVTLTDGDLLAFGFVTASIGGVAQANITLARFSPAGELRWSKEITRGAAFLADNLTMNLRAPTRIHVDAAENIYLLTFLGGPSAWRSHVLKLTTNGDLVSSWAYTTAGEIAGHGAIHVNPTGSLLLAFETISSPTRHALTALQLAPDGSILSAVRRNGWLFDVAAVHPGPGDEGYFVTGTTRRCGPQGERITYVAQLPSADQFGTVGCDTDSINYNRQDIPVEVQTTDWVAEPVVSEEDPPLALAPLSVQLTSVGCPVFAPAAPPTVLLGCGPPVTQLPLLDSVLTSDGGRNINSVQVEFLAYDGSVQVTHAGNYPSAFSGGGRQLTVTNLPTPGASLSETLKDIRLSADNQAALIGTHRVALTALTTCGNRLSTTVVELTVQEVINSPLLPEDQLLDWCPGDTLSLTAFSEERSDLQWSNGSRADTINATRPGIFSALASNPCGSDTVTYTLVEATPDPTILAVDTTLLLCPEEQITYALPVGARTQVQWEDGTTTLPRAWTSGGEFTLQLTGVCLEAEQRITVLEQQGPPEVGPDRQRLLCPGGTDLELSLPHFPGAQVRWLNDSVGQSQTVSSPGVYDALVDNGCGVDTLRFIVAEGSAEPIFDELTNLLGCRGDSVTYLAVPNSTELARWEDGSFERSRMFTESGDYVLIRNNGCATATTTISVTLQNCCKVYLPTAFSPNGDSVNDVYQPLAAEGACGLGEQPTQLRVYDRWGGVVQRVVDGSGWDGSGPDGRLVPNGVYLVIVDFWDGTRWVQQSQSVTLLR